MLYPGPAAASQNQALTFLADIILTFDGLKTTLNASKSIKPSSHYWI
jgi:hypothetical protein